MFYLLSRLYKIKMYKQYEYMSAGVCIVLCFFTCVFVCCLFLLILSECSIVYIPNVNKLYQLFTVDVGGLPLK